MASWGISQCPSRRGLGLTHRGGDPSTCPLYMAPRRIPQKCPKGPETPRSLCLFGNAGSYTLPCASLVGLLCATLAPECLWGPEECPEPCGDRQQGGLWCEQEGRLPGTDRAPRGACGVLKDTLGVCQADQVGKGVFNRRHSKCDSQQTPQAPARGSRMPQTRGWVADGVQPLRASELGPRGLQGTWRRVDRAERSWGGAGGVSAVLGSWHWAWGVLSSAVRCTLMAPGRRVWGDPD